MCRKVCYYSKQEARHIMRIMKSSGKNVTDVYPCNKHGEATVYHLTSMSKRDLKRMRKNRRIRSENQNS